MNKWQTYDTYLYRKPVNTNLKSTLYVFNLIDLCILTSFIPTRSPEISRSITSNIRFIYNHYPIDQLFLDLPVTKCIENPYNTIEDCPQLEVKQWIWKSESIPSQLKMLAKDGNICIYFNPTITLQLPQTYNFCNMMDQVINELKINYSIYALIATSFSSIDKIVKTIKAISKTNFTNVITNFTLLEQPSPIYPNYPELILTVGTSTSGLANFIFPESYVKLSSPILFTELSNYPINTSFIIYGSHLTYGERALYIKYANNLNLPVRIFWFAQNAFQQDTDVPSVDSDGVPIIRIN